MPPSPEPKKTALPLLLLGVAALALLAADWYWLYKPAAGQVSGDTLIHLIFARNAADGRPFEFNPGFPSRALTAPLWNWLLTLAGVVTGTVKDPEAFLLIFRVLSLAVLALALRLVWGLSRQLGATTIWTAAGVLVVLTNPSTFYWTAANPMETSGAVLLTLAFIWWAGWTVRDPGFWRWVTGGALTMAGFLMRPELLVFGGLSGLAAGCLTPVRQWKNALGYPLALAAGLGAWTLFLRASGLAVLPNAGSARRLMLLLEDASSLPVFSIPYSPDAAIFLALFAPLVLGAILLLRDSRPFARAAALAGLLIAAFCLFFFTFYFYTTWQGRYLLPAVFAVVPPGVAGLSQAFRAWKPLHVSLGAVGYATLLAILLIRPLGVYADAPRQRSLLRPAYVQPGPDDRRILVQEIQSAYFYPELFHVCTEGLIGLESLEARRRDLSVLEFIQEQQPDLIGLGRYPLKDPEDVVAKIREAASAGSGLSLPGLDLVFLGPMEGCGPVFRVRKAPSLPQ
ncbi:MAG: hypothetical protein ACOYMS_05340 [Terrimicrobiaceae bacterium]